MRYMITLVFFLLLISSQSLFSIGPEIKHKQKQTYDNSLPVGQETAYTIEIPGEKQADGSWAPSKFYRIPLVAPKYYLPNMIHIKTKKLFIINDKDKGFRSDAIQSSLNGLNIKSVRAPFVDYSKETPQTLEASGLSKIYEVTYSSPVNPYDVCKSLMSNPEVEYAVPVFISYPTEFVPNDPSYSSQWAMQYMDMEKAWDITQGDKNTIIAIVDSGTDLDHGDLKANIWSNPKEIPNNNKDDDGNGKVDDVNGWDFVGNISQNEALSGVYREDKDPRPGQASNFHGTHTAGCASAVTNNNVGIAGTGFKCSILPVKCGSDNGNVRGIFRGYEGIVYAAKLGAQVINCSWGGPGYSPVDQEAINEAVKLGSVVVVSAGNEGNNLDVVASYPANYDNVMNIGASTYNSSTKKESPAYFSNYGFKVTVYAPGQGIYSTMPNNSYANEDGTSMSSPIAAGVAGLVRSLNPGWTPKQVMKQIRATSDNVLITDQSLRQLYFGRVNAFKALAYNSKQFPALKIPGLEISKITMEGGNVIKDFNPTYIHFTLSNLLADVGDLKVKVTALDKFVSLSTNVFNVGTLKTNQTMDLDLEVKLLPNNPWFDGNATLLITYESTDYSDYELINLPISIKSDNSFEVLYQFADWIEPYWHSSHSSSIGTMWSAGQSVFGGMYFKYSKGVGGRFGIVANDPLVAIYGFSDNKAVAGTGTSNGTGNSQILLTTDGGANWSSVSVGGTTGFINAIHFFDENNGVYLGDPKSGKWGIGRTSDGGNTWTTSGSIPVPTASENGFAGAYYAFGDKVWYGTTKGRVLRSSNRGVNWQVSTVFDGGHVWRMGFVDENNGIAIYSEQSNQQTPKYVASTTDGGSTWKMKIFNLTDAGIDPVFCFTLPRSNSIITLSSGGQIFLTKDLGKTWSPILTKELTGAQSGAFAQNNFNVRIWSADLIFSALDYMFIPEDAKREITRESSSPLAFDTVNVGDNIIKNVEVKNTGEVPIKIKEVTITPGDGVDKTEFDFALLPPETMDVDKLQKIKIRFKPKTEGLKTATFKLVTDAKPSEITVELNGFGKTPVSVPGTDNIKPEGISIFPNPAGSRLLMKINNDNLSSDFRVDIYNSLGELINNEAVASVINPDGIEVNIDSLPQGYYSIRIKSGRQVHNGSFIKLK